MNCPGAALAFSLLGLNFLKYIPVGTGSPTLGALHDRCGRIAPIRMSATRVNLCDRAIGFALVSDCYFYGQLKFRVFGLIYRFKVLTSLVDELSGCQD